MNFYLRLSALQELSIKELEERKEARGARRLV